MSDTVEYYDKNAAAFYNGTVGLDLAHLYQPFLTLIPEYAHILDAGCGSGRDSLYFLNHGYKVTAFDASALLVSMSSKLTGLPVHHLTFDQVDWTNEFDGIWACASLLHVPRSQIDDVIEKLTHAIKPGGVIYASLKYGTTEEHRNGRLFSDYDENSFQELLDRHPNLHPVRMWQTNDYRPEREHEVWLNVLVRKLLYSDLLFAFVPRST